MAAPGALIARFVRAVKLNLPEVEIWGDGSQVRDFMDVKDFARFKSADIEAMHPEGA